MNVGLKTQWIEEDNLVTIDEYGDESVGQGELLMNINEWCVKLAVFDDNMIKIAEYEI